MNHLNLNYYYFFFYLKQNFYDCKYANSNKTVQLINYYTKSH